MLSDKSEHLNYINENSSIDTSWRNDSILLLFFFLLTLALYFESRHSGFVTDYIGFEQNYDGCGFFNYYKCSGGKNFRYLQHAFSYPIYKYFGSDRIIWYVLYCLAHAIAAFSGYKTLSIIFSFAAINHFKRTAFYTSLLFLVSPFHNEVIIWKVCIQYSTITICLFVSIYLFLKDFKRQKIIYPLLNLLLFVIGLLSLEQIIILPYFLLLIALFLTLIIRQFRALHRFLLYYYLPQHFLIAFYFAMSKIVYGQWVMHYGASTYSGFISLDTAAKVYNYFIKYLALVRFYPHDYKAAIFSFTSKPIPFIFITSIALLGILILSRKFIQGSKISGLILLMFMFYVVSLLPVIQLYFSFLLYSENDRLGYLSSFFIFALIVLFIFRLHPKIRISFIALLICANIGCTFWISHLWMRSTEIYTAYYQNFDAYTYEKVFLLGVPDNYHGIPMMRAYPSGLEEALRYRKRKPFIGKMLDVIQFNQVSKEDGMQAKKINDSTLLVKFTHNGSWFWYWGLGAKSYETPEYKVTVEQWHYTVSFKNFNREKHIILYPDKLKWKQIRWE